MTPEDEPYALRSPGEIERRMAMLTLPDVKPLIDYLQEVKSVVNAGRHQEFDMPCFDPCDGGINARALFLLEAPGPKAVGSTFISRNNPDPTARNMCELMQQAGIPRKDTLLWNVVPWYVGENGRIRAVTKTDIAEALPHLKRLIDLLPNLEVIVLIGGQAQLAARQLRFPAHVQVVKTYHMSQWVFNVWPEKKQQTQANFVRVAQILTT